MKIECCLLSVECLILIGQTAANYLNKLADDGLLRKERLGTGNYYINEPLFELLSRR